MRIDIITIFPSFKNIFEYSILKRAKKLKHVSIEVHDIRDYSNNKQKKS